MKITQVRNATQIIEYAGKKFLIDPMLSAKGAFPGFPGTVNDHLRNPLVELPIPVNDVINVDAIIVTHLHTDHWDDAARALIPREMPIFVQNTADRDALQEDGFSQLHILDENSVFAGIKLTPTRCQHGSDDAYRNPELAQSLGDVAGVILQADGEPVIYIAADTIWTRDVENTLNQYQPQVVVLNTGYALLPEYGPIIMGKEDVLRTHQVLPNAQIISTHMEAVNHAGQTRKELREYIAEHRLEAWVSVPEDGEVVSL
jgi:L-ascorbate metabolism protein UlaG (beta-lactamase superfamily)